MTLRQKLLDKMVSIIRNVELSGAVAAEDFRHEERGVFTTTLRVSYIWVYTQNFHTSPKMSTIFVCTIFDVQYLMCNILVDNI